MKYDESFIYLLTWPKKKKIVNLKKNSLSSIFTQILT